MNPYKLVRGVYWHKENQGYTIWNAWLLNRGAIFGKFKIIIMENIDKMWKKNKTAKTISDISGGGIQLVCGGIGGEISEMQLVHWVQTVYFLQIFLPFLSKLTNISENENIREKILWPRTLQHIENLFFNFLLASSYFF